MSIYCYRTSPALGALHCLRRASNVCLALSTVPADTLKKKEKDQRQTLKTKQSRLYPYSI